MATPADVKEQVKEKYGSAARAVAETGSVKSCCDPGLRCCDPITTNLYSESEKGLIPGKAVLASLGCGNPTALLSSSPARRCSISAPAAASTCCSRRVAWRPAEKPTAWT